MARDKLEAANLQMAEQEKTSRRVSTILKPGGNLTGKDAIIRDLKDNLKRQKTYNDKLEKKLDSKQEALRELEEKLKDLTVERDSVKEELQRSFSRMDVDDRSGGVNIEVLITDPNERFVTPDYSAHEDTVNRQYNEVVQENEELRTEVGEVRSKLKKFSAELERERIYTENVESKFEQELLKNKELQDKVAGFQQSRFESVLPVIQESFEESLYDGNLTNDQIQELLDKLDGVQEELNKERIWVKHLEEQNDQLRIDLSKVQSVDKFTGDEKDELYKKYSETENMLDKRLSDLEEAQRTIDELRQKLNELKENEVRYRDDVENVSEQLEHSLIELSDHELMVNALTVEKTDLEVQIRELRDEMHLLVDKTVAQQEEIIALTEEKADLLKKISKLEEVNESAEALKNNSEEVNHKIASLESECESTKKDLTEKTLELDNSTALVKEKARECSELLKHVETIKTEALALKDKFKATALLEQHSKTLIDDLEEQVQTLNAEKEELDLTLETQVKELSSCKIDFNEKSSEYDTIMGKVQSFETDAKELTEKLKEVTVLERNSKALVDDLSEKVETLTAEKECFNQTLITKEGELALAMKKIEESDIDTKDLKEKLMELENLEVMIKEKDNIIIQLQNDLAELKDFLEREKLMNQRNREAMDSMQAEARAFKLEKQQIMATKIETEARVKLVEQQCVAKIQSEHMMNEKNRSIMDEMQKEVRKERAERAILQTALIDANKTITSLQEKDEENKNEMEKLSTEIKELSANSELLSLQSAMASVHEAMQDMEKRDVELMQTIDEKMQHNSSVQADLKIFKEKLAESTKVYNATIFEKDATISDLETALSEEIVRGDSLEQVLKPYQDKTFDNQECQVSLYVDEFGCQIGSPLKEMEMKSTATIYIARKLEEKVKVLEERISLIINDGENSRKQLEIMDSELEDAQKTVAIFKAESVAHKNREEDLTQQLKCVNDDNKKLKNDADNVTKSMSSLMQENKQFNNTNKALQTELDIQLEARTHIDNVIDDKEKEFLEIADKYNLEKAEKNAANESINVLSEEKCKLENSLVEAQKQLEDEKESSKCYQDDANEAINSLNCELRKRLLDQAYAHNFPSDSEDAEGYEVSSKATRKSLDFKEALEETKISVKTLAKANDRLGRQIEKLLIEKDSFINKSSEESNDLLELKNKMSLAVAQNEKLEAATRGLEIELIEKEVVIETLEENLIAAKRESENSKVEVLKKSSPNNDKATLTALNDLKHRCFMVTPSDPAREILHMFVSQYKDNLCTNCYARITTLGSRPSSPRKASPATTPRTTPRQKRRSDGGTSDILVQTDSSLFPYGSDSAYSSTISMQADQSRDYSVERLKTKTNQLSNDLSDSKKSEKEMEMALQYQLKIAGELQKKVGKIEIREKALLDQIAELKEIEAEAAKKEEQYAKLLTKFRGKYCEIVRKNYYFTYYLIIYRGMS